MREALRFAALRGLRTTVQALAGVSAAVPIVSSTQEAKVAIMVATWGAVGAVLAGVAAFLMNFSERLEAEEV